MNQPNIPSPKEHPNTYAALSASALTAFLVTELKTRLNVDISYAEAGYIVAGVTTLVLFFGKKVSPK